MAKLPPLNQTGNDALKAVKLVDMYNTVREQDNTVGAQDAQVLAKKLFEYCQTINGNPRFEKFRPHLGALQEILQIVCKATYNNPTDVEPLLQNIGLNEEQIQAALKEVTQAQAAPLLLLGTIVCGTSVTTSLASAGDKSGNAMTSICLANS